MNRKDQRWWLEPEGEAHGRVLEVVKSLRQEQEAEKLADVLHSGLYGNTGSMGYGLGSSTRKSVLGSGKLSLNVVRNMVGAVTSKIASKNKPKPTFLTEEGNYEQREKAEKLEKFVSGVFYESGVYALLPQCFRAACVSGTGALKIFPGDGKVDVQWVRKEELVVSQDEARYGEPRNLYERRYYDTLVLTELAKGWGDWDDVKQGAIEAAASAGDQDDIEYAYKPNTDQVLVTEAWHLGESEDKKGRHVICVENATLLDEEWDGPFPFAFLRWSPALEGFWGVGLAEELMGIQAEINKLLQQIQRGHHLIAGHWLVEASAKNVKAHINNDLAAIVTYAGTKPEYNAPQIISPEVYNHLWQLYAKAFEIAGISQLNATGQKPAGLDSGAAQRAYQDIQTERFLEVGQAYEEFVVECARQVVRCAKKLGGKYKVRSVTKGGIEFIDWSDINLSEDMYWIKVFPTNLLPATPAGKLQLGEDLMKLGMSPEDMADIIDFPDTDGWLKRRLAARKIIQRNVSHMIKTGEFISPEPFDNHQLALRLVNEEYHQARLDGVPEEKLELLRRYMADTQDFLKTQMPEPMAGPPPPMDPMMAPPMGPPMGPVGPLPPGAPPVAAPPLPGPPMGPM